jgi:elongation factor G
VLAHVFKVTVDPYVGKMGIFRIHQGTITRDSQLYVGDGRKPFKVGHLFMLQGKDHVEVPSAGPGDICAVAKVDEIHFDAVLRRRGRRRSHPFEAAGLSGAGARPGDRAQAPRDEQRLWEILQKLVDEDPAPGGARRPRMRQ